MDRLHLMSVFVAVAEEQGFAGAARRLGLSPPAVTRAIAALETRLGVKLLQRTTRFVRVTEAGQRYVDDARRILAEVEEADDAVAGINGEPRGHLVVTAPVLFGKQYVMPAIVAYLQRYPGMTVSAVFVDRVVNLLEEGMDVGIRIGALPDSTMKAIAVGSVRRVVCAAPSYLQQHGVPQSPAALAHHVIVAASAANSAVEWAFGERSAPVRLQPRLTVSSNEAAIAAAVQGFGLTRLLSYQIRSHLEAGQLQTVLDHFEAPPLPIHVLHRESRHPSIRVRAFLDLVSAHLKAELAPG